MAITITTKEIKQFEPKLEEDGYTYRVILKQLIDIGLQKGGEHQGKKFDDQKKHMWCLELISEVYEDPDSEDEDEDAEITPIMRVYKDEESPEAKWLWMGAEVGTKDSALKRAMKAFSKKCEVKNEAKDWNPLEALNKKAVMFVDLNDNGNPRINFRTMSKADKKECDNGSIESVCFDIDSGETIVGDFNDIPKFALEQIMKCIDPDFDGSDAQTLVDERLEEIEEGDGDSGSKEKKASKRNEEKPKAKTKAKPKKKKVAEPEPEGQEFDHDDGDEPKKPKKKATKKKAAKPEPEPEDEDDFDFDFDDDKDF